MANSSGNTGKPRNERPARGDNRTGQTIWRLGWMGARAKYGLDGEKFSLPQVFCLARTARRSISLRIFWLSPNCSDNLLRRRPICPRQSWFFGHGGQVGYRHSSGSSGDGRIGVRFPCPEQIVTAGSPEISGGFNQGRAYLGGLQRRIALQHQGHDAADVGGRKRGAGRHLIFVTRRRQEDIYPWRGNGDMAAAVRRREQLVLRVGRADRDDIGIGGGIQR